jgi:hypothetical protein
MLYKPIYNSPSYLNAKIQKSSREPPFKRKTDNTKIAKTPSAPRAPHLIYNQGEAHIPQTKGTFPAPPLERSSRDNPSSRLAAPKLSSQAEDTEMRTVTVRHP